MIRADRFPLRRYDTIDDMKTDEYAYWQARTPAERISATTAITAEMFKLRGLDFHASRLRRSLVRIER